MFWLLFVEFFHIYVVESINNLVKAVWEVIMTLPKNHSCKKIKKTFISVRVNEAPT